MIHANQRLSMPINDSFLQSLITKQGKVEIGQIREFQHSILDIYPHNLFKKYCQAIFHLDHGANVHASNTKKDFVVFYPIKSDIQLVVRLTTECEGIAAVITCLTTKTPPIILAPLYY